MLNVKWSILPKKLEIEMTNITVQIEDATAEALREKANRFGLKPEQFLTASVESLVGQPDPDFD